MISRYGTEYKNHIRPADTAGRLEKEIRTYDLLDRLGVEYERVDHAPAMTMEVCQEIDQTLHAVICKNLFLCNRQETKFYLLMIPDTKVFHTKDLSAQIHSARLSFAKPEYICLLYTSQLRRFPIQNRSSILLR